MPPSIRNPNFSIHHLSTILANTCGGLFRPEPWAWRAAANVLSPRAAKIRHSTKSELKTTIQAHIHLFTIKVGHVYGDASAHEQETRQWLVVVAAQRSPAVTSLLAAASLYPIAASPPSVYAFDAT